MKNDKQPNELINITKCVKLINWANDIKDRNVTVDLNHQELASYILEFYKEHQSRMAELKELRKWNNVDDCLPDKDGHYVLIMNDGNYFVGEFCVEASSWFEPTGDCINGFVYFWYPIPENINYEKETQNESNSSP